MNRGSLLIKLLNKAISESFTCGKYKCYRMHVHEWKRIMSDDDDLTIMTLLEHEQIMTVKQMDDLVWEESPMFSYKINLDEINNTDLSTNIEDNHVNKLLNRFNTPRVF